MQEFTDTIVAPITGPGPAAVAVLRLSGPQALPIANQVFHNFPTNPAPRHAYYGSFIHQDDGLATLFPKDNSYTGEETVEFSIHGSPASIQSLTQACITAGARLAAPGEFTLRAFMNGRIDLSQAEGVRTTVDSLTNQQLHQAHQLRSGALTSQAESIRKQTLQVLAMVEASTDFSEEIGDVDHQKATKILIQASSQIQDLLQSEQVTTLLHQGLTIAILGRPNAGKSSLLNALLKQDRAIVTEIPGTTRDAIEATIDLNGFPIRLIDTAGLRQTQEVVEQIGIERSHQIAESANLILYLFDSTQPLTEEDQNNLTNLTTPYLLIANKSDLPTSSPPKNSIPISATTGQGLESLTTKIQKQLNLTQDPTYLLPRHYPLLHQTHQSLQDAIQTFQDPTAPDDLASIHLRQATRLLGELTGESTPTNIIDQIFADFCLGK